MSPGNKLRNSASDMVCGVFQDRRSMLQPFGWWKFPIWAPITKVRKTKTGKIQIRCLIHISQLRDLRRVTKSSAGNLFCRGMETFATDFSLMSISSHKQPLKIMSVLFWQLIHIFVHIVVHEIHVSKIIETRIYVINVKVKIIIEGLVGKIEMFKSRCRNIFMYYLI